MPAHYESRISTQANENELLWRGFLADEDSYQAVSEFKRAKEATARGDENIVLEAKKQYRTIITSNGWDFVGHIKKYQKLDNNRDCRDLWGLLVIPNHQIVRGRTLTAILQGIEVSQVRQRLQWPVIGFLNLCVRLKDSGHADVSRFKRCMYCESEGELRIKKPWADWYAQLPVV